MILTVALRTVTTFNLKSETKMYLVVLLHNFNLILVSFFKKTEFEGKIMKQWRLFFATETASILKNHKDKIYSGDLSTYLNWQTELRSAYS